MTFRAESVWDGRPFPLRLFSFFLLFPPLIPVFFFLQISEWGKKDPTPMPFSFLPPSSFFSFLSSRQSARKSRSERSIISRYLLPFPPPSPPFLVVTENASMSSAVFRIKFRGRGTSLTVSFSPFFFLSSPKQLTIMHDRLKRPVICLPFRPPFPPPFFFSPFSSPSFPGHERDRRIDLAMDDRLSFFFYLFPDRYGV